MNIAIDHNNEGIIFLEKGQNDKALLEFKKAAQLMYSITQELKNNRKTGSETQQQPKSLTLCTSSKNPIATENSFIRSTPILMAGSQEPTDSCQCTIESATVLLNMALTYHIDSLTPNCMKGATQSAIALYDMSYSLGLQVNEDTRSHHIILTALNNLGQLYYELGDYNKSRLYLEDLSTYVMFLGPGEEENAVRDRHEFLLNAMVLRNPNTSAGAA